MFIRNKLGQCLVLLVGLLSTPILSAEAFLCFDPIVAMCDLNASSLEDCIEIVGFNEEVISEIGTTTTYFGALKVIKRIDETTPKLFAKAGSGVLGGNWDLDGANSGLVYLALALLGDRGGTAYVRYSIELERVQITSISQTGGEGEPLEQVEFTPIPESETVKNSKVIWTYQPLDEAGACLPIVQREAKPPPIP